MSPICHVCCEDEFELFYLFRMTSLYVHKNTYSSFAISAVYKTIEERAPPTAIPPNIRPIIKYSYVGPKYTNTQNMMHGNVNQVVARLHPHFDDNALKKKFPNNAPLVPLDASHEISSLFIGPDMSGVSSDMRSGITAVTHA